MGRRTTTKENAIQERVVNYVPEHLEIVKALTSLQSEYARNGEQSNGNVRIVRHWSSVPDDVTLRGGVGRS